MSLDLTPYLEDLESRIDPTVEEALLAEWKAFASGRYTASEIFAPQRPAPNPSKLTWPKTRTNETLDNFELMALQQFQSASDNLAQGSGRIMNIRCNYGTPILAMPFGVKLFIMPDDTDTLPACHPRTGGIDTMKAIVDRGIPDLKKDPYTQKVFEMGRRYVALKAKYPKISKYVQTYHPDMQGPTDICELIWGSDLFVDLYDVPDLVKNLLDIITQTYIQYMREWIQLVPLREDGFSVHWNMLFKGPLMLRDDSAMNLSPEMFHEFIRPYDERLLREFGGGAIHACGKVDHFAPILPLMPHLTSFNLSQPHLNDMEVVFKNTVDRGIVIVGLQRQAAEAAVKAGRSLHGRVHCW